MKTALLSVLVPAALYAATVSGTVTVRGSGDPIAGATVVLVSQRGLSDSTTTDAKGAYAFDSVATGFRTVAAYKDGYQAATANVNVLTATGKYAANIAMTAVTGGGTQTGTIAGTVKDDSTKEAIANATVILSHPAGRGQPTPIDTVTTDGEGRFLFAAVPALTNYIVEASAAGFASSSNLSVNVVAKDTARVPLTLKKLPKPSSAIVGKVTDAASKAAITGAMVVLRKRVQVGNNLEWQNMDSTLTGTDGAFSFTALAASSLNLPYSLLVSKTDYNPATSANLVVANNNTDTANVALTKIAKGTTHIFVGLDSTGNPALAGAGVAATLQGPPGTVYTGTTDAKGWVTFTDVISGSYSVSASLVGFVSKEIIRAVAPNEQDTGYIYLARATALNAKALSGLIRDASGKAVEGAKVIFQASGNGGITLSTASSATGDYAFGGLPIGTAGGTVTVQKAGYGEFTGSVTLATTATFLNVTLKTATSILHFAGSTQGPRLVRNGSEISLQFPAASVAGKVSLFDFRGALIRSRYIPAGLSEMGISTAGIGSRAGFLILEQGGSQSRLSLSSAH